MTRAMVVLVVLLAGCTQEVNRCKADADCTDPAHPFCDVDGEYPASDGQKGVCTVVPMDCPVDRCGCAPGATTCGSDQLVTCNADGKSQTTVDCSVGCEASGTACKTFTPANGLGAALTMAGGQPDTTFPASVTIDTDTGAVTDSSGTAVTVMSMIVAQGAGGIRVFVAGSFAIQNATISGSKSVAFVASGPISIGGIVDASANGVEPGPGALGSASPACGGDLGHGGGGGGNGTAGGSGAPMLTSLGATYGSGGAAQTAFEPLVGGGDGGAGTGSGGGGGGAIETVSLTSIDITSAGIVDIGGGGGAIDGGGGGAGGSVILQAPTVRVSGIIAANGASGAACGVAGNDATRNTIVAASVGCTTQVDDITSGTGGTATVPPTVGDIERGTGLAGGGGAVGRALISTLDGTVQQDAGAIISAELTKQMLDVM